MSGWTASCRRSSSGEPWAAATARGVRGRARGRTVKSQNPRAPSRASPRPRKATIRMIFTSVSPVVNHFAKQSTQAPRNAWKGAASPLASGVDDRFHAFEVALQGAAAGVGQPVLRLRHPPLEVLLAGDVAGLFQLAGVDAQVAVRRLEQLLEVVEAQVIVHRQGADDAETHPIVDQAVEIQGGLGSGTGNIQPRLLSGSGAAAVLVLERPSHRASRRSGRRTSDAGRRSRLPAEHLPSREATPAPRRPAP